MAMRKGLGVCKVLLAPIGNSQFKKCIELGNDMEFVSGHKITECVPIIAILTL